LQKEERSLPHRHAPLLRFVRLLVVDHAPEALQDFSDYFCGYQPYHVTCAGTAAEADALLSADKKFHVCLSDVGAIESDQEELLLLKKHAKRTPFIIITESPSVEIGFKAYSFGASSVLAKPIDFSNLRLINAVNTAFLHGIFKNRTFKGNKPALTEAMEVFVKTKPLSVKDWVEKINIEDRYLRKICRDCFGHHPRDLISVQKLLVQVFKFYDGLFSKNLKIHDETIYSPDGEAIYAMNRFQSLYTLYQTQLSNILKN